MPANPFADGRDPDVTVGIGGDASGIDSAIGTATGRLDELRTQVGLAGAALGTLSTAALGGAISASADFDQAMQESVAVMGDVDAALREDLEETASEVAESTTASHEEAAESFYFLASAGLEATDSIAAMPEVAAFAEAGQMDMAKATDYATDVMSAFGFEADELTTVTDAMTATVTRHNQTMNGMGEAMSMVAPIASGLGMSIQETSAAIGFMGDAGIKGSRAGRTLRQALNLLSSPTAAMEETLTELGVAVQDSEGNMRSMSDILVDLEEAGASTADIMELFGARAGPGMQVLLDEGGQALEEETEKIEEMGGVTQDVAETQRDTFNAQLEIARSKLNGIAISIGEQLLPPLTNLLEVVTDGVDTFASWNEETDGMLGVLALASGAIGGFGLAAAAAIPMLGGMATAAGMIATPLLAATGLAAGLAVAWDQNFGDIQGRTKDAISTIETTIDTGLTNVETFWTTHETEIETAATNAYSGASSAAETALGTLDTAVSSGLDAATGYWDTHGDDVESAAETAYGKAKGSAESALGLLETTVSSSLDGATSHWDDHGDDVDASAEEGYTSAHSTIDLLLGETGATAGTRLRELTSKWDDHGDDIDASAESAYAAAQGTIESILGTTETVVSNGLDGLESAWDTHKTDVENTAESAYSTADSVIGSTMGEIGETVAIGLDELDTTMSTVEESVDTQLSQPFDEGAGDIDATFSSMTREVRESLDVIEEVINGFTTAAFDHGIQPAVQSMSDVWNANFGGENGIARTRAMSSTRSRRQCRRGWTCFGRLRSRFSIRYRPRGTPSATI